MLEEIWQWSAGIVATALGALVTVVGWFTRRWMQQTDKRLNSLERVKANKESTDQRFDRVLGHMDRQTERLDELNHNLAETNANLSRVIGRMEERDRAG